MIPFQIIHGHWLETQRNPDPPHFSGYRPGSQNWIRNFVRYASALKFFRLVWIAFPTLSCWFYPLAGRLCTSDPRDCPLGTHRFLRLCLWRGSSILSTQECHGSSGFYPIRACLRIYHSFDFAPVWRIAFERASISLNAFRPCSFVRDLLGAPFPL